MLESEEALRDLCLPIIEIDNNLDGQEFIETAVSVISDFLRKAI